MSSIMDGYFMLKVRNSIRKARPCGRSAIHSMPCLVTQHQSLGHRRQCSRRSNFQVLHAIKNLAKDAKRVYLHATMKKRDPNKLGSRNGLIETVRMYGQTLDWVENNQEIEWLVGEYRDGW